MDKTEQAHILVRRCYKRFNKLIALMRPIPGNSNPVKFDKDAVDIAVRDFEILLDEVRELTNNG